MNNSYNIKIPGSWNRLHVDFYDDNRIVVDYNVAGNGITQLLEVKNGVVNFAKNLSEFADSFPISIFKGDNKDFLSLIENHNKYSPEESKLIKIIIEEIRKSGFDKTKKTTN